MTTESYLMDCLAVRPDYPDVDVKESALRHLEHETHLRPRFHLWKVQLFNNFLDIIRYRGYDSRQCCGSGLRLAGSDPDTVWSFSEPILMKNTSLKSQVLP